VFPKTTFCVTTPVRFVARKSFQSAGCLQRDFSKNKVGKRRNVSVVGQEVWVFLEKTTVSPFAN